MPRDRRSNTSRGGSRSRSRDEERDFLATIREHPYASAAAAAGAAGVAAASAFLWSRRSQISEAVSSGMESLKGEKSQSDIAEEALTLKESGKKTKGPRGPIAQQDVKAAVAPSNQEMKAGARAYS